MSFFFANSTQTGGSETAFVTSHTGGVPVAIAGGADEYGYRFTVGGAGITITQLGVYRIAGAYADFTVRLFGADGTTLLASAVVDFDSVSVGQYAFASITPVAVPAGAVRHIRLLADTTYNEFLGFGGDIETSLTTTAVATINGDSGETGTELSQSSNVNFKYTS